MIQRIQMIPIFLRKRKSRLKFRQYFGSKNFSGLKIGQPSQETWPLTWFFTGAPGENRTPDTGIRNPLLCPLSYRGAPLILPHLPGWDAIGPRNPLPHGTAGRSPGARHLYSTIRPRARPFRKGLFRSTAWERPFPSSGSFPHVGMAASPRSGTM